jgi:hypothetical protein
MFQEAYNGAALELDQAYAGGYQVTVQYLLADGAFRKNFF